MLPEPLGAQDEPGEAVQVQLAASRIPGTVSVTVAPVTVLGPAFATVIV